MSQTEQSRTPVNIEDEMKRSYLDYAMSVIIGRALPAPSARAPLAPTRTFSTTSTSALAPLAPTRTVSTLSTDVIQQ